MNINETKNKLVLKYVNKLLTNMNKPNIDNLLQFIDIDREFIITETNTNTFHEMVPELFSKDVFDKKKCGYYRKSDSIALNCLRGMLKDLEYNFTFTQKDVTHEIDGKKYRLCHSFYSIKNKNI